jgi:hypothetical protein
MSEICSKFCGCPRAGKRPPLSPRARGIRALGSSRSPDATTPKARAACRTVSAQSVAFPAHALSETFSNLRDGAGRSTLGTTSAKRWSNAAPPPRHGRTPGAVRAAVCASVWRHVPVLLVGAILAPGRPTDGWMGSSALRAVGQRSLPQLPREPRVLNRAVWSGLGHRGASRILLGPLVATVARRGAARRGAARRGQRRTDRTATRGQERRGWQRSRPGD